MKTRFIKAPEAKAAIDRWSNGIRSEGDAHRIIAWLIRLDFAAARRILQLREADRRALVPVSSSWRDDDRTSLFEAQPDA